MDECGLWVFDLLFIVNCILFVEGVDDDVVCVEVFCFVIEYN